MDGWTVHFYVCLFIPTVHTWNLWKLISVMEYKGNCDLFICFVSKIWLFILFHFFFVIVNLQYLSILKKSELHEVISNNRNLNCEIKRSQILFLRIFILWQKQAGIVTKGHVWWSRALAYMRAPPPPDWKQYHSMLQLNFYTLYKVMTHSVLDSMLPRTNALL